MFIKDSQRCTYTVETISFFGRWRGVGDGGGGGVGAVDLSIIFAKPRKDFNTDLLQQLPLLEYSVP